LPDPFVAGLALKASRRTFTFFDGFDFCCTHGSSCPVEETGSCWDWLRTGARGWGQEQTSLLSAGELFDSSSERSGFLAEEKL